MSAITTIADLREYFPSGEADDLNVLLATEALAHDGEGEPQTDLAHATSFQIEGYVLQPRKLRSIPVEIVTDNADDACFVLTVIRSSQGPLAYRQAGALAHASNLNTGDKPFEFCALGARVETEDDACGS